MWSGERKVYWNEKESDGPGNGVSLVQVYSDKRASTMKRGAFVMSPVPAVLLNLSMDSKQNLTYTGHTLMGLISVEHEENHSTVQGLNKCSTRGTQLSTEHRNWCV